MQIAIATTDGKVSLWCDIDSIDEDGTIHFNVINGGWNGTFKDNMVHVNYTNNDIPGLLVWAGHAKFNVSYYNEAIGYIQNLISSDDYVLTPPESIKNIFLEEKKRYAETYQDEVPF